MMVKIVIIGFLIALHMPGHAQSVDSIGQAWHEQSVVALELKADSLQMELLSLSKRITELETLVTRLDNGASQTERRLLSIEKHNYALSNRFAKYEKDIADSISDMRVLIANYSEKVDFLGDGINKQVRDINNQLNQTDTNVQANQTNQHKSVVWGIVVASVLSIVSLLVYLLLRLRISKQAEEINCKVVEQMGGEFDELLKIVSQLKTAPDTMYVEPDHSLVKGLADRITFMEMTLYRMDDSVKGHKHLTKSIKQMKDNLKEYGYEIVDMLGKDYVDGLKAISSFNDDDSIESGRRIITGVIKPQINYKGQMIQAAQIIVSQNI